MPMKKKTGRKPVPDDLKRVRQCFSTTPMLADILRLVPNRSRFIERALWAEIERINVAHGIAPKMLETYGVIKKSERQIKRIKPNKATKKPTEA